MSNTTHVAARNIHGTNPQFLIEKITRMKIYNSLFWKEHCFAVTAELLLDKAILLKYVAGCYGGLRKPSDFLCLVLKMLQIQPSKEIVLEFIKDSTYKYVRILGAFYLRLVGNAVDVYKYLEPLYSDYRKIRLRTLDGKFSITHVDELIDKFLNENWVFDIALQTLPKREIYVKRGELDKYRTTALKDIPNEILNDDEHIKYKNYLKDSLQRENDKKNNKNNKNNKKTKMKVDKNNNNNENNTDSDLDDGYIDPYADPNKPKNKKNNKNKTNKKTKMNVDNKKNENENNKNIISKSHSRSRSRSRNRNRYKERRYRKYDRSYSRSRSRSRSRSYTSYSRSRSRSRSDSYDRRRSRRRRHRY